MKPIIARVQIEVTKRAWTMARATLRRAGHRPTHPKIRALLHSWINEGFDARVRTAAAAIEGGQS